MPVRRVRGAFVNTESGPLHGLKQYKVDQSDFRAEREQRQIDSNVAQSSIHHCLPAYMLTRASDGNFACLEDRFEKHSPATPFSQLDRMISNYLEALPSYALSWGLLLVVLAWAMNDLRARIKVSESARRSKHDNSHQKSKNQGKETKKYNMAMGIRKLDLKDWLRIDESFSSEHRIRSELLTRKKDMVLQCVSGSEDSCIETLEVVVEYQTENFPGTFRRTKSLSGCDQVLVVETGEVLNMNPPFNSLSPLELAARLAMEDLNILSRDGYTGEHHL